MGVSGPCRFTSGGKNYGTHCIWGWVGPRAGVVVLENR